MREYATQDFLRNQCVVGNRRDTAAVPPGGKEAISFSPQKGDGLLFLAFILLALAIEAGLIWLAARMMEEVGK